MYILEIGKRNSNLRQAQTQRKRILKEHWVYIIIQNEISRDLFFINWYITGKPIADIY